MNDFDDKLKKALENGKPIEFEREETLRQMVAQTFRSKMRWMVVWLWFEGIAVMVLAGWSGYRLYHAQEMKQLIVWATVLILSAIFFVLVKVVGWQWAIKYSLLREIKRLELQVAGLKEEK
jgi:uncharacterized membrane protein